MAHLPMLGFSLKFNVERGKPNVRDHQGPESLDIHDWLEVWTLFYLSIYCET